MQLSKTVKGTKAGKEFIYLDAYYSQLDENYLPKAFYVRSLNTMIKAMIDTLKDTGSISLVNLFKLEVIHKGERPGRNPKTLEPVTITERNVVRCHFSDKMKSSDVGIGSKLTKELMKRTALPKHVVLGLLTGLRRAIMEHDEVEIRGFGCFSTRVHRPRNTRNPATGEDTGMKVIEARYFRSSALVLKEINN